MSRVDTGGQDRASLKGGGREEELRKVASQFEALLIGQLLQSMSGEMQDQGEGGTTMMEFAQEHMAKSIADGGGLGLAKLITGGLRQKSDD